MGSRILIIDDNPDQIVITRRVLKRMPGCSMDDAPDGDAGLKKAAEQAYDLVLCDYRLPGKSGMDVLRALRQSGKDVPFILATSAGTERVAVEAMQAGAYDYVVKDAAYEELLPQIIQRTLDRYAEKKERERLEEEQRKSQAELAKAYAELRQAQEQLIQAAKLESVGRLAAGAAHEVKNPLAVMLMGIEYLSKNLDMSNENIAAVLTSMQEALRRADNVIRGLLDFSAHRLLEPKTQPLVPLIEKALNFVKHELDRARINCRKEFAPDLPDIRLDGAKLEQVFVNLFMNAIHAMPPEGTLAISIKFDKAAARILVEVDDTGSGIPEDMLPKIFDPFFTTKPTGQGTGLGLSVTRTIVQLHGGTIDIRNKKEGGVRVTVAFAADAVGDGIPSYALERPKWPYKI